MLSSIPLCPTPPVQMPMRRASSSRTKGAVVRTLVLPWATLANLFGYLNSAQVTVAVFRGFVYFIAYVLSAIMLSHSVFSVFTRLFHCHFVINVINVTAAANAVEYLVVSVFLPWLWYLKAVLLFCTPFSIEDGWFANILVLVLAFVSSRLATKISFLLPLFDLKSSFPLLSSAIYFVFLICHHFSRFPVKVSVQMISTVYIITKIAHDVSLFSHPKTEYKVAIKYLVARTHAYKGITDWVASV